MSRNQIDNLVLASNLLFIQLPLENRFFTPTTPINDAPIAVDQINTGEEIWDPKTFRDDYVGLISMRDALVKSKKSGFYQE